MTRATRASLWNHKLNAVRSSAASGARTRERGRGHAPDLRARPRPATEDELTSVIFCYTSLDRPAARTVLDAIGASAAIDVEREFALSDPALLGPAHEAVVREHTADGKRTVFCARLTGTSALSADCLAALAHVLRRGFPDLLMLWRNELRL